MNKKEEEEEEEEEEQAVSSSVGLLLSMEEGFGKLKSRIPSKVKQRLTAGGCFSYHGLDLFVQSVIDDWRLGGSASPRVRVDAGGM